MSIVHESTAPLIVTLPAGPIPPRQAGAIFFEDQVCVPASALTLAGFRRWANSPAYPERGRISYIRGNIEVDMNADELRDHNPLKVELVTRLHTLVKEEDLGVVLLDGARVINEAGDFSNEPDLVFAKWETIVAGRVRYVESEDESGRCVELEGTPDLVIEVVSKHSVRKDVRELPQAYYEGGIPEYWLIIPQEQGVEFRLMIRGEKKYEPVMPDADGYVYSKVFNRSFLILRTVNRIGKFSYRILDR
jgi:Uma2 family endonuclease